MPYDNYGRWIPPDDTWRTSKFIKKSSDRKGWVEATAAEGGRQWTWDELFNLDTGYDIRGKGDDFRGLVGSGLLGDLFPTIKNADGTVNVDKTMNIFNTSQWNQATGRTGGAMRYSILRQYQDYYHGEDNIQWAPDGEVDVFKNGQWVKTDTITGFDAELREDLEWGLDVQRAWYAGEDFSDWASHGAGRSFQELMGLREDGTVLNEYFRHGSEADFRYYNNASNPLLQAMRRHVFGVNDYRQDYDSVQEIREARMKWSQLTVEERNKAIAWSEKYIKPYQDHEQAVLEGSKTPWEFHKSMEFDPETNTMTYYDNIVGHKKLDLDGNPVTHTIEPPADPESLEIRTGPAVDIQKDEDGNRIMNESSVNELYQRYLGRNMNDTEKGNWSSGNHYNKTYDEIETIIQNSSEGQANKDNWLDSDKKLYFNPQEYGSPESIKAKMVDAPDPITPPTITIRNIGKPKKPVQSYMALPSHWLTEAPTIASTTRGDTA